MTISALPPVSPSPFPSDHNWRDRGRDTFTYVGDLFSVWVSALRDGGFTWSVYGDYGYGPLLSDGFASTLHDAQTYGLRSAISLSR